MSSKSMHFPLSPFLRCACGTLTIYSALFSIGPAMADELTSAPLAPRSAATATLFEELGKEQTGLDLIYPIDDTHALRYLYASAMSTGGVAIGDFDQDGKPDIFLTNGPGANKLFRQSAPMKFDSACVTPSNPSTKFK